MNGFDRRTFLKALAAVPAASVLAIPRTHASTPKGRVLVVGGGYGGATVAKYLRVLDPGIAVTLVERETLYTSCPLSNEVISGERDIKTLQVGYDGLRRHGVEVVHDEVTSVDPIKKVAATAGGKAIEYDALVLSPGVDFDFGTMEGLTRELAETRLPHAWKAGPQTL